MKKKIDWLITLTCNGVQCEECGKTESRFISGYCDAQTVGMYKYNHPEFQLVLNMDHKMILHILNSLGLKVQSGRTFKDGDIVDDLFIGYNAKIKEFSEDDDQKILRVLIPDTNHKFPEDEGCQQEYAYQALPIDDLYVSMTSNFN